MNFSLFKSLRAAALLISTAGVAQVACAAPLDIVIGTLADYKTFRLKSAELDSLVAPYCKRVRDKAQKSMVLWRELQAPL